MADSFYGGVNGQDFSIKTIFSTKVELDNDIDRGWVSPIQVGEFVVVSYGMPNGSGYEANRQIDLTAYNGKTYNSTLWRKAYDEDHSSESNGLSYELISSMTGNTPKLNFTSQAIAANEAPSFSVDYSDVDYPQIQLNLPHSWDFKNGEQQYVPLAVGETPTIEVLETAANDGYTKEFKFSLPKSQVIRTAVLDTKLDAGESPQVRLDIGPTDDYPNDTGSIEEPILRVSIPQAQLVQVADAIQNAPNTAPKVRLLGEEEAGYDVNKPTLIFTLPSTREVRLADSQVVLAPDQAPKVDKSESNETQDGIEKYYTDLVFSLPRAVRFYYGSLLGSKYKDSNGVKILTDSEVLNYATGDYYINEPTGFIYLVTSATGSQTEFTYKACLRAPLPQVSTEWFSPFDLTREGDDKRAEVSVEQTFDNAVDELGQKLKFNLPKIPKFKVNTPTFLGSEERNNSKVEIEIADADTIAFDFTIAEGSNINIGMVFPTDTSSLKPGDIFIHTEEGKFYKWDGQTWNEALGTIKGPTGSSLRIVGSFTYTSNDVEDKVASVGEKIKTDLGELPAADGVVAVTYQDLVEKTEISYWYFYVYSDSTMTSGEWGRVQLTGGVSNLIENEAVAEGDTNKAYSVTYVNALETTLKQLITDKRAEVYSKEEVDKKISEWGTFSSLAGATGTVPTISRI